MPIPDGAQLSDDGFHWWDGDQWQRTNVPEGASLSDDRQHYWDGQDWQQVLAEGDSAAAVADAPGEAVSTEVIDDLVGSADDIAADATQELLEDEEFRALYEADPDGFVEMMQEIVQNSLQESI